MKKTQHSKAAFAMRYGDAIPARTRVPLNKDLRSRRESQRRTVRVADTLADPRFSRLRSRNRVAVRSELAFHS